MAWRCLIIAAVFTVLDRAAGNRRAVRVEHGRYKQTNINTWPELEENSADMEACISE